MSSPSTAFTIAPRTISPTIIPAMMNPQLRCGGVAGGRFACRGEPLRGGGGSGSCGEPFEGGGGGSSGISRLSHPPLNFMRQAGALDFQSSSVQVVFVEMLAVTFVGPAKAGTIGSTRSLTVANASNNPTSEHGGPSPTKTRDDRCVSRTHQARPVGYCEFRREDRDEA